MADIENNMKIRNGVIGGVVGGVVIAAIALGYKFFFQQPSVAPSLEFAIGKYYQTYSNYRMATEAEWRDPAFQAALVQAHREGGGWALLEQPLECNNALFVHRGAAMIDGAPVVEVRHNMSQPQQLRGVYPAMNLISGVAWTTTEPALGDNWTVKAFEPALNSPCLFVNGTASTDVALPDAASPGGGSRRSRRHKWSKRARKQKKKGTKRR